MRRSVRTFARLFLVALAIVLASPSAFAVSLYNTRSNCGDWVEDRSPTAAEPAAEIFYDRVWGMWWWDPGDGKGDQLWLFYDQGPVLYPTVDSLPQKPHNTEHGEWGWKVYQAEYRQDNFNCPKTRTLDLRKTIG